MNPHSDETWLRLLVVEDDPVSAAFLRDAVAALPARVHVAGSLAEARRAIDAMPFDLWLVDAHLPDGPGDTLLDARGSDTTPALAHTAATETAVRDRLLGAGFREVLCKPLGVVALHAAIRRHLRAAAGNDTAPPPWDDAAALLALGGDAGHVGVLRGLFLQELPYQRARLRAAASHDDEAGMRAELHRLAASCGFVGAARLASSVRELQASPLQPDVLQRFEDAADELMGGSGEMGSA
ncbi:MAG: response regulator [Thermomonas sp.]